MQLPNVIWPRLHTLASLNNLVSEAVDLVVHTERGPSGPQVTSILAVEDLTAGPDAVQFTTTELFSREREGSDLEWTGLLPIRAGRRLERHGFDVRDICGANAAGSASTTTAGRRRP